LEERDVEEATSAARAEEEKRTAANSWKAATGNIMKT
jgi:hypothetical protein